MNITLHTSLSLNFSATGYMPNIGLHYQILGAMQPKYMLIGSKTAKEGLVMYGENIPPESEADMIPPTSKDNESYWLLVDSKGRMEGQLHTMRSFEKCRDVIVYLTESTPESYLTYLKSRQYKHHILGSQQVNLVSMISHISNTYGDGRVAVDSGGELATTLYNLNLVDEISFVMNPTVSFPSKPFFSKITHSQPLQLLDSKIFEKNYVWLHYRVLKSELPSQETNTPSSSSQDKNKPIQDATSNSDVLNESN